MTAPAASSGQPTPVVRVPARPPELTVLRLARPHLRRLLCAGLLAAGTDLAGLALMATATWLLMTAAGRPPLDTLTVAIVAVRALAIGRGVLRYTERLAGHDAVLRIVTEVRTTVFAALVERDRAQRAGREAGRRDADALSRLVSDTDAVQDLFLRVLVPAATAGLVGVLAVAAAATVTPGAALTLAAGLLCAGVGLPVVAILLTRRDAARVAPLRAALAVDAVDLTHGAADLAAFGAVGEAVHRAADRAARLARVERRLALSGWAVDALGLLVSGVTAAAVTVVALRAQTPGVLVGVLAVGTLAAVEAGLAVVGAARQWTATRAALRRVTELIAPAVRGRATGDQPASPGATSAAGRAEQRPLLRIEAVTVTFRAGARPALADVDLSLPAGRRVAVVGPSGAGKSTLLAVLTGLVRPDSGRVSLAGVDIATYPDGVPTAVVSGLTADAHVFHASVRDNLLLGRADAGDEELTAAVTTAGLLDWVRQQPAGFDTPVGEGGGRLSGGQRQRLTLARALLARPAVLVLDEPTEGLDPAAADRVLAAVTAAAEAAGQSVVLVTHRLAGLDGYDEILVLDAGRVTQRGRPQELVRQPGWYREQWLLQRAAEEGYLALAP